MLQQLEILSELDLGQVRLVVKLGQKLGHYAKLKGNLVNTLDAAFFKLRRLKLFQNVCLEDK